MGLSLFMSRDWKWRWDGVRLRVRRDTGTAFAYERYSTDSTLWRFSPVAKGSLSGPT